MGQETLIYGEKGTDDFKSTTDNSRLEDNNNEVKKEYMKIKMEEMQRKIDELKDKVKLEGEILHNEEVALKQNDYDDSFIQSLSNSHNAFNTNVKVQRNSSDQSLYFSASSYSLCSLSSSSNDSAYYNFTEFVNSFVKTQNQKERLSILQCHSNKQISLNMMRHSLTEIDSRCSAELQFIEKSLQRLQSLAAECNIKPESDDENESCKVPSLGFSDSNEFSGRKRKIKCNQSFVWSPLKVRPAEKLDWNCNPVFQTSQL